MQQTDWIVLALIAAAFVVALIITLIVVKDQLKKRSAIAILIYLLLVLVLLYVEVIRLKNWWAIPIYAIFLIGVPIALNYVVTNFDVLKSGNKHPVAPAEELAKVADQAGKPAGETAPKPAAPSIPASKPTITPAPAPKPGIAPAPAAQALSSASKPLEKPAEKQPEKPLEKPAEKQPESKPSFMPKPVTPPAPTPRPVVPHHPAPKPVVPPTPAPKPVVPQHPAPKPVVPPRPVPRPAPKPVPVPVPVPTPTPAPAPAPAAREITYDSLLAKADKIKALGHSLAAADLYQQSRKLATTPQEKKRAYFAEIKSRIDGGDLAAGQSSAAALKAECELSPVELLKLDAMLAYLKG